MDARDPIAEANPATDTALDTPDVRAALAELGAAIRQDTTPARRRPPRGRVVAIGLGVTAAMAVAVPAAADAIGLGSGWFGSPGMTENDTSEFLDLNSPEFPAFARGLVAHLPLPPGESFDDEIAAIQRGGGLEQGAGIAGQLALHASCDWTRSWIVAHDRGDATGMAAASRVMDEVPTWPEIIAVDGGGVVAQLRTFADGARRGDAESFRDLFDAACGEPGDVR